MPDLVAHVECTACGHQARIPLAALGDRRGPALWRVLRCSACGSLGKAELRLIWAGLAVNPMASAHGQQEAS